MKEKRRRRSKREVLRIQLLGVGIFLIGVSALVVEAVIEEICKANYFGISMIAFIASVLIALIVIGSTFCDVASLEMEKQSAWANAPLTPELLRHLNRTVAMETFRRNGFKPSYGNMLEKRCCSLRLDFVRHFVRWAVIENGDAEKAINMALDDIKRYLEEDAKRKRQNSCFFLFLATKNPDEETHRMVQSFSMDSQHDTAPFPLTLCKTAVPIIILVDTEENDGCFWSPSDKADTLYAHGCRLLKKYFHANTVTAAGR